MNEKEAQNQNQNHITINLKATERKIIKTHLENMLRETAQTHRSYCYDNEKAGSITLLYPKEYKVLKNLLKKNKLIQKEKPMTENKRHKKISTVQQTEIQPPTLTEFEHRILYSILCRIDINMKKLPDGDHGFSEINLEFEVANGAYRNFYNLFNKIEKQAVEISRTKTCRNTTGRRAS